MVLVHLDNDELQRVDGGQRNVGLRNARGRSEIHHGPNGLRVGVEPSAKYMLIGRANSAKRQPRVRSSTEDGQGNAGLWHRRNGGQIEHLPGSVRH